MLQQTERSQTAVMTIEPGEDAGPAEEHAGDQIIYVVEGEAIVRIGRPRASRWPGHPGDHSRAHAPPRDQSGARPAVLRHSVRAPGLLTVGATLPPGSSDLLRRSLMQERSLPSV